MQKINRLLETLPPYLVACLESPEYAELFEESSKTFELTDQQKDVLEEMVIDIYVKDVPLDNIQENIQRLFGFSPEKTRQLAQHIVGEFVVPFPNYFQDSAQTIQALGGTEEEYIEKSTLLHVLVRFANTQAFEHIQNIQTFDYAQKRSKFSQLVEKNILDYFGADDAVKMELNNLAVDLFLNVKDVNADVLRALYENKQVIGEGIHIERDGKTYPPHVVQWLKDFISFSDGDLSTLHVAQYMAQNKNVRQLNQDDKETLRHILELHRIAKLFPESLAHIPVEQWMIIPFAAQETVQEEVVPEEQNPSPPQALPPSESASPPAQNMQAPDNTHITEGAGAQSAAPLLLPPELEILELPAPSATLHELAPVVVHEQHEPTKEVREISFADLEVKTSPFSGNTYQELADEVLAMSGFQASDKELYTRLQNLVVTRLRNIRTSIEIRERLADPVQRGGFGLDAKIANSIMRNANMAADLLLQGALVLKDIQVKPASIQQDIQEIQELVKREFTPEQKKLGRSRIISHAEIHRKVPLPPVVLPPLPEQAALADIPMIIKKPVPPPPPPPPKLHVSLPQFSTTKELEPLEIVLKKEKPEVARVTLPPLVSRPQMQAIPVKIKEIFTAVPPKLDSAYFRKALKSIPVTFVKKLTVQQITKTPAEATVGVTHKQPHSFFGAVDVPQIQHTGLPAFSIEEVDGVPMIVEKEGEQAARRLAEKKAAEEKTRQEAARQLAEKKAAEEQKVREEMEKLKAKKQAEDQKVHEEMQKAQKAAQDAAEQAKKIAAEQSAQIETLKKELQQKEEKARQEKAQQEVARQLAEKKAVEEKAQKEIEKAKKQAEEKAQVSTPVSVSVPVSAPTPTPAPAPVAPSVAIPPSTVTPAPAPTPISTPATTPPPHIPEESPITGAMPQEQKASGGLFSNIFHIPVTVKSAPQQPGKISFADIKKSPRLVDTIEELRILTLKDFRRLSEDPLNAASRIYDKIQAMERESFTKKLTAIQAWRENEINMLYVNIGQEALLKGKSITSVIDQLKTEGKPYLTEQEFDAILELNERIRM